MAGCTVPELLPEVARGRPRSCVVVETIFCRSTMCRIALSWSRYCAARSNSIASDAASILRWRSASIPFVLPSKKLAQLINRRAVFVLLTAPMHGAEHSLMS